tara:strand:+ start:83 stop:475 length:393 start_codon:yes stop_codon:yes gene_type:complete
MKKKIRIGRTQGYILDTFIKENLETLNRKKPDKIARVATVALGFEISPSTIISIRKAMIAAGLEVWEEAPRSKENKGLFLKVAALEKQMEIQLAEQDRKFKIVFEKLHDLTNGGNGVDKAPVHEEEQAWQ